MEKACVIVTKNKIGEWETYAGGLWIHGTLDKVLNDLQKYNRTWIIK